MTGKQTNFSSFIYKILTIQSNRLSIVCQFLDSFFPSFISRKNKIIYFIRFYFKFFLH